MKAAAVQFRPEFKDCQGNLRALANLVKTATEAGAKLIVLPELATTGYSMMSIEEAEPLAEVITEFDPNATSISLLSGSMNLFYALASKFNVHIVWGLVEKDCGTGNLHNTQVMMCPDGTFDSVRKINGFGNDFLWSIPGRANPPIRKITVGGKMYKVGLLLCRDVRDKKDDEWKEFYEKGDANIVALSTNWGKGAFPATAWMEFAEENETILVVSNRYGVEANNDFGAGGVGIISPDGKVQCDGLVWSQDCIVYGNV
jgi:predicted amidohydrolase